MHVQFYRLGKLQKRLLLRGLEANGDWFPVNPKRFEKHTTVTNRCRAAKRLIERGLIERKREYGPIGCMKHPFARLTPKGRALAEKFERTPPMATWFGIKQVLEAAHAV